MVPQLSTLLQKISQIDNEEKLRLCYMDVAGNIFKAQHWGITLHNRRTGKTTIDLKGLPDRFVDYYNSFGAKVDPIRAYVEKYHVPAHEQMLFDEASWKQTELYINGCGRQYDHQHIMTGPIVGEGKILGTLNFARTTGTPAFNQQDIMVLTALAAHLSATLAYLRSSSSSCTLEKELQPTASLTPREQQIALLVAQGKTNRQIGQHLWISENTVKQALKCIFRRLNLSSRTQLVAWLARSPYYNHSNHR